jgi:hypothetical protein
MRRHYDQAVENHADRGRAGAGLIGWGITALLSLALLLYAWWVEPDWIEVKEHDRKHAQVQEPIRVGELFALYLTEIGWTLDSHQALCIRVEKFYFVEVVRISG